MRGVFRDTFSPGWFDRASPICDGLKILYSPEINRELITGAFGALSGTTPPTYGVGWPYQAGTARCRVLNSNGGASATQSWLSLGQNGANQDLALNNKPMTVYAIFQNSGQTGQIIGRNDNNTVNAGWAFGIFTGNQAALKFVRGTTNYACAAGITIATTGSPWIHILIAMDGTQSATAGSGIVYQNGVPLSGTSLTAGVGTQGSDSAQTLLMLGNQSFVGGSLNGGVSMVAVWNRMLFAEEVQSLYVDPLQLFRSRTQIRRPNAVLGGGVVSKSLNQWLPAQLAVRLRSLQQGTLNVGNTRQNVANLIALATAQANAPSNPPWAKWRTAINAQKTPSNLRINVPLVPGYVAPPNV